MDMDGSCGNALRALIRLIAKNTYRCMSVLSGRNQGGSIDCFSRSVQEI